MAAQWPSERVTGLGRQSIVNSKVPRTANHCEKVTCFTIEGNYRDGLT